MFAPAKIFCREQPVLDSKGITKMLLSYIITTCNRPALLEKAVTSVAAERHAESELIIVDDHGKQPVPALPLAEAAFPGSHRLIRNRSNLGVIGARNVGIAES